MNFVTRVFLKPFAVLSLALSSGLLGFVIGELVWPPSSSAQFNPCEGNEGMTQWADIWMDTSASGASYSSGSDTLTLPSSPGPTYIVGSGYGEGDYSGCSHFISVNARLESIGNRVATDVDGDANFAVADAKLTFDSGDLGTYTVESDHEVSCSYYANGFGPVVQHKIAGASQSCFWYQGISSGFFHYKIVPGCKSCVSCALTNLKSQEWFGQYAKVVHPFIRPVATAPPVCIHKAARAFVSTPCGKENDCFDFPMPQ